MKKLSKEEEIREKILKLDKCRSSTKYYWDIRIDGTGFTYDVNSNTWWKLPEPYIYTYPLPDDFYEKIRNEVGHYEFQKASSIDEVLETVSDNIRDSILFNLNLFR